MRAGWGILLEGGENGGGGGGGHICGHLLCGLLHKSDECSRRCQHYVQCGYRSTILTKSRLGRQIFVNNSYIELNENLTEGLVTDERSLTDIRGHHTRRSSLIREERLRKLKVKATSCLRTVQSAGLRGGIDDGNR